MRWLLLEPYYDGSHRHLVDALIERIAPDAKLWTLPARKWKWRMRGASLEFARRLAEETPRFFAERPLVVYFHENQLAYPVQHFDKRDHHFAWTNLHTALAADELLFNSRHNLETLVDGLEGLARKMPDTRPLWAVEEIAAKAQVLPVPIDTAAIDVAIGPRAPRSGPCHFVWNHRWEFDKGPERLLDIARALVESGEDFAMSVLGQSFRECPPIFDELRTVLGPRVRRWGFVESRSEYLRVLASADVALSTAHHEFEGLATLEAAACGAVPLVPDALAYREIWPAQWRVDPDALATAALERLRRVEEYRAQDPRAVAERFAWAALEPEWRRALHV